jgi:hypothetical protein
MIFPPYTKVYVPAGVLTYHAVYADKLTEDGKLSVDLTIPVLDKGFYGIVVRTIDKGGFRVVDLRPNGPHTKIENLETEESYMFLDSMIVGKVFNTYPGPQKTDYIP